MINFLEKSIKYKIYLYYRVLTLQTRNAEKIVCNKYKISSAKIENCFHLHFQKKQKSSAFLDIKLLLLNQ